MNWLLIIAVGTSTTAGGVGVSTIMVTEAQCKKAMNWLHPAGRTILCIGPDGTVIESDDTIRRRGGKK